MAEEEGHRVRTQTLGERSRKKTLHHLPLSHTSLKLEKKFKSVLSDG